MQYNSKNRIIPTKNQTKILCDFFISKSYINEYERRKLSEKSGLPEKFIRTWFQNKRAIYRNKTRDSFQEVYCFYCYDYRHFKNFLRDSSSDLNINAIRNISLVDCTDKISEIYNKESNDDTKKQ